MKKPIKTFIYGLITIVIMITVSQYFTKMYRMDNLEIKTTKTIIIKKEIQPEGEYQQYSWVGKTMRSFTVHKVKEFLIFTTINNKEVSFSVSETSYLQHKINDKITVEYVELPFKKIIGTNIK